MKKIAGIRFKHCLSTAFYILWTIMQFGKIDKKAAIGNHPPNAMCKHTKV